ncbi:hypothetical protein GY45DRAFT_459300 [Cubamyces sp. BRFM 1775]|nr:hypothetical protein GY45DRAFT_459300 [Cubamyces sp. BRFM 1775]
MMSAPGRHLETKNQGTFHNIQLEPDPGRVGSYVGAAGDVLSLLANRPCGAARRWGAKAPFGHGRRIEISHRAYGSSERGPSHIACYTPPGARGGYKRACGAVRIVSYLPARPPLLSRACRAIPLAFPRRYIGIDIDRIDYYKGVHYHLLHSYPPTQITTRHERECKRAHERLLRPRVPRPRANALVSAPYIPRESPED